MNTTSTHRSKFANYLVAVVLVLVPLHAFLTVWGSALIGHYVLLRLWDDVMLVILLGICLFWLGRSRSLRQWFMSSIIVRLILAYTALTLLLGVISLAKSEVTPKALAYGLLINLRFLAWFIVVALSVSQSDFLQHNWRKIVLVPAALVVLFGALQYTVLPHNFLGHFGYNAETTIAPIETINHNAHYIRVQSTLRGANPLGAYLVIVLAALGTIFTKRKSVAYGLFGLVALLALYASGSRSAWIGSFIALAIVLWFRLKTKRSRQQFGISVIALALIAGTVILLLRNNTGLENALFHTQKHSVVATSSNGAHASALKSGVEDVVHQPFGDGPGTAGPASAYNGSHKARVAENYYIQIAQETGWIGLVLFVSILILVARALYVLVPKDKLALLLLASLIGISFVNLLSHAWADDTLAFLWWGLAGGVLGRAVETEQREVQA